MTALRRVLPVMLFGVLPVCVAVGMFAVARRRLPRGRLPSRALPAGQPPARLGEPLPGARGRPSSRRHEHDLAAAAAPRRAGSRRSPRLADGVIALVGIASFAPRCSSWASATGACSAPSPCGPRPSMPSRRANLTPALPADGAGLALRDRRWIAGIALGAALAIKFFLWPLGVWLAASPALAAGGDRCGLAALSLLLVLPFTGIDDYVRLLFELGSTFDEESYTSTGSSSRPARPIGGARADQSRLGAACSRLLAHARASRSRSERRWCSRRSSGSTTRRRSRPARCRSSPAVRGVARAARDVGPAERRDRRRERLGKRPRADRVRGLSSR